MKLVVLDGYTLNPGDLSWEELGAMGDLAVLDRTKNEVAHILEVIGDAEVVLTNKTILPREVLEQAPALHYIGVLATGYNVVDIVAAKELGITVTNVPSYSTQAVAQYTMALLLEMCHRVGDHSRAVHKGEWVRSVDFSFWKYPLVELEGLTIGIVGFGQIGQAVAKLASAFGMKVLVYNANRKKDVMTDIVTHVSWDDLLAQTDVISLHCPLKDDTREMINAQSIRCMKNGVRLINTGRGPLVNETDLVEALQSGKVAAAALDVISEEPMHPGSPLLGVENCIVTPHIAWAPKAARARLMKVALNNLKAYLSNKPVNRVW